MARVNYSRNEKNRLSDHDMLLDMLTTEKFMSHLYDHAVLESASDLVRDSFQTLQRSTQSNAHKLYELMNQRGWYKTVDQSETLQNEKMASQTRTTTQTRNRPYLNPGLNGTHRGKSGIYAKPARYIEHFNTPQ